MTPADIIPWFLLGVLLVLGGTFVIMMAAWGLRLAVDAWKGL